MVGGRGRLLRSHRCRTDSPIVGEGEQELWCLLLEVAELVGVRTTE
jgi:hypothetical protein